VIGQIIHQDIKGAARFIRPDRHPGDACPALSFSCGAESIIKKATECTRGKDKKTNISVIFSGLFRPSCCKLSV
jgi:hypothetical protein